MVEEKLRRILALDTSKQRGSVALLEGSTLVAELRLNLPETHSARLLRSIQFLLDVTSWEMGQIDLIAAATGPGSFTGIRIGIATALGLAQSLEASFAGVSVFDALAYRMKGTNGRLGVVLDAQRSQVYCAEYSLSEGRSRLLQPPRLVSPSELAHQLRRRMIVLVGDGAERYADVLGASGEGNPRLFRADLVVAEAVGRVALARPRSWRRGENLACEPLYIRPPDALKPGARRK